MYTHKKPCNQLYPQSAANFQLKMPLFVTPCTIPRRLSARSRWKFVKISLQLRHVCPSVSRFVLKKKKRKWQTGIYNTWYWTFNKICSHIPTLFATRHNNRPHALHENPHTHRKYPGRNSSNIYRSKKSIRTKVQCVHYVQHIFDRAL